jgi:preprotein translocase subunit YajC
MGGLIILVFIVILFWIAVVRPQRARSRQQQALIASIEPGDEIVSAGGLYGTVKSVEDDVLHVEIADGLEVRMARNAVAGFVEEVEEEPAEPGEAADPRYPEEPADDRTS